LSAIVPNDCQQAADHPLVVICVPRGKSYGSALIVSFIEESAGTLGLKYDGSRKGPSSTVLKFRKIYGG